jgi:hypothetical protein
MKILQIKLVSTSATRNVSLYRTSYVNEVNVLKKYKFLKQKWTLQPPKKIVLAPTARKPTAGKASRCYSNSFGILRSITPISRWVYTTKLLLSNNWSAPNRVRLIPRMLAVEFPAQHGGYCREVLANMEAQA